MPAYTLTLDDLKESTHPLVQKQAAEDDGMYYERSGKKAGGMKMAEADVARNRGRGFTLNGQEFGSVFNRAHAAEGGVTPSFEELVKKEFKSEEVVQQLNQAYSQNLEGLIVDPLVYHPVIGMAAGRAFQAEGRESNLYRKGQDIYYKATVKGYTSQRDPVGYFAAPTEILYKLKEHKSADGIQPSTFTFELQHIKTHSKFIRDVFLQGEEMSPEHLASEIDLHKKRGAHATVIAAHLIEYQTNMKSRNPLLHDTLNIALEAITLYKENKLDATELEIMLKNLLPIIQKQEKPASLVASLYPSKTMATMKKAIADVKKLPDYVPQKTVSRKNLSKAANDDATPSPSVSPRHSRSR